MTDQERPDGSVRGLVVPVDGPGELRWLDPTLDALQAVLGGWLEAVGPGPAAVTPFGVPAESIGWHAYCDEVGKLKNLPSNKLATQIAHVLGWPHGDVLCGPVVFLGDGPDGGEADVPELVVQYAQVLYQND